MNDNNEREPGVEPCATCGKLKGHDETRHCLAKRVEWLEAELAHQQKRREEEFAEGLARAAKAEERAALAAFDAGKAE